MNSDTVSPQFSDDEEMAFWIEAVMADFRDGAASPEDIESLRALLLQNAAARETYIEANQLSCLLEVAASEPVRALPKRKPARPRKAQVLWALTGIAAVLVAGFWLLPHRDAGVPKDDGPIATLAASHEAVWDGAQQTDGASFDKGTLALRSGIAEIEFANGARFVLEGPCELEIIDGDSVRLKSGKLWGHCPPQARGFEVLAPGGHRVVDLGTEFGVGVDPSGSTDVHVFDGEVEVFPNKQEKQALEAGSAIQMAPGELVSLDADRERFTSSEELQRERWLGYHSNMLKRDDLLLYYDFDADQLRDGSLQDRGRAGADGRIIGALPVNGRVPGKQSLLFEKPEDAIAMDLGEQPLGEGFTVAMWIKPDAIVNSFTTLLNSNGYDEGDIHFQLIDRGSLRTGIESLGSFESETGPVETGVWQLVAVTWDLQTRRATLFHNGIALPSYDRKMRDVDPQVFAKFGRCQVGAWGDPTFGYDRNFVGRIDEVLVFSEPLDAAAMQELYQASRP